MNSQEEKNPVLIAVFLTNANRDARWSIDLELAASVRPQVVVAAATGLCIEP
jgi:hypothetical protein